MGAQADSKTEPLSLVGRHETGGLHAWNGFDRQRRYIAMRAPEWATQPGFVAMSPETFEDVDVRFLCGGREVVWHIQVKMEQVTPSKLKGWVEEFTTRNAQRIEQGIVQRYVVAAPHVGEDLRNAFTLLEHLRSTRVAASDAEVLKTSRLEVVQRFERLGLGALAEVVVELVYLDPRFDGTESDEAAARVVAANLSEFPLLQRDTQAAAGAVAKELLRVVGDRKRFEWTGAELEKLVRSALQEHRAGPPRPAGDVVLVRHGTLRRVTADLSDPSLLDRWKERRHREVDASALFADTSKFPENVHRALAALIDPAGAFLSRIREEPPAELAYFGFPHVPFAVAAGFLIGSERHVSVVEHDRDTGRFAWPDTAEDVVLAQTTTTSGAGQLARLRISISATVDPLVCPDLGELGLDIHVSAVEPRFDLIRSDAAARRVAREVRRALAKLSGNAKVSRTHVFAAVPVSVAVLLGQALAAKALPPASIYNFAGPAHYDWFLNLDSLGDPERSVGVVSQSPIFKRS